MPDVRYVCLSDLHLGEEDSLLTQVGPKPSLIDPLATSPVLLDLVACLRKIISANENMEAKPTLILTGDVLELALATTDEASMVFERFLEAVIPPGKELFSEIIYIPGNHDHHLWEAARETQYARYVRGKSPGQKLQPPWHVTYLFRNPDVHSELLNALAHRVNPAMQIAVAYPNFGLWTERENRKRSIIFSHGHYVERRYHLITRLRNFLIPGRPKPQEVWHIEEENFAWIDFFWSTLGRSGEMGKGIEAIYERLREANDRRKLLGYVASRLTPGLCLPFRLLVHPLVTWLGMHLLQPEKHATGEPLTSAARNGLKEFVCGPLRRQILREHEELPEGLTLVFGHTHKPFLKHISFGGYQRPLAVYNTGGWVVESKRPVPIHGASIVLADDQLNVATIRMYNESDDSSSYSVKLEPKGAESEQGSNPLRKRVSSLIDPSRSPWSDFSASVCEGVRLREERMRVRLHKPIG